MDNIDSVFNYSFSMFWNYYIPKMLVKALVCRCQKFLVLESVNPRNFSCFSL